MLFPLCTPHHSQYPHTGNCIWPHSSCPYGLGPLVSLILTWWLCCPWNMLVCHTNVFKTFCYAFCIGDDHISYARSLPCGGLHLCLHLDCGLSCVVLVLSLLCCDWYMIALGLGLLSCRLLLLIVFLLVVVDIFVLDLLMAQLGYMHLTKASIRCCYSFRKSSGLVQTVLALWVSVPMTLYLVDRLWWVYPTASIGQYGWGLWYTVMERELSASGVTKVSRKGMAPFPFHLQ